MKKEAVKKLQILAGIIGFISIGLIYKIVKTFMV